MVRTAITSLQKISSCPISLNRDLLYYDLLQQFCQDLITLVLGSHFSMPSVL